jgi:hypothetical protein
MRWIALFLPLPLVLGCSTGPDDPDPNPKPEGCAEGQELFRDRCVDPALRYEPEERIDHDNVMAFGEPITALALPDPPKSGFRIVAPPRDLAPGEEVDFCLSWPFPAFQNRIVYAGRLYTTTGLHHSNVITKVIDPNVGPNPYPDCHGGADDPFSQLPEHIPDVLFANSTQIEGGETLTFPVGMGFPVDPTREIVTNIHYLNTRGEEQRIEVVYDFFTMSEADLETEVAPFFLQVNDFNIPPHSTGDVGGECTVFGGTVVEMMPHTHKLATEIQVDLIKNGVAETILEQGAFDTGSDIHLYDPGLDLTGATAMRYRCTFNNTTDHDVTYGLGENEMCIMFGYLHPVKQQFVAYSDYQGEPCNSVQIGLFR